MKKLFIAAMAALMVAGGVNVAVAEPGPNGRNDHGLCTAYFAGSDNGKANKRDKGPFPALVEKAEDEAPENNDDDPDNDVSGEDAVASYCSGVLPGGGGGGEGAPGRNRP